MMKTAVCSNNLNANVVGRVSNIVRRILVEKKPGFDIEAQHLLQDLKENLGLTALTRVRIINRYDMEGVTAEAYQQARNMIFFSQ